MPRRWSAGLDRLGRQVEAYVERLDARVQSWLRERPIRLRWLAVIGYSVIGLAIGSFFIPMVVRLYAGQTLEENSAALTILFVCVVAGLLLLAIVRDTRQGQRIVKIRARPDVVQATARCRPLLREAINVVGFVLSLTGFFIIVYAMVVTVFGGWVWNMMVSGSIDVVSKKIPADILEQLPFALAVIAIYASPAVFLVYWIVTRESPVWFPSGWLRGLGSIVGIRSRLHNIDQAAFPSVYGVAYRSPAGKLGSGPDKD